MYLLGNFGWQRASWAWSFGRERMIVAIIVNAIPLLSLNIPVIRLQVETVIARYIWGDIGAESVTEGAGTRTFPARRPADNVVLMPTDFLQPRRHRGIHRYRLSLETVHRAEALVRFACSIVGGTLAIAVKHRS